MLALGRSLSLQERLNGAVLLVELGKVWHKVLDNVHVGQRVNLGVVCLFDSAETGECVDAVNVHGTRATDALTTRSSEGEGGVDFVLDLDERVKYHGTGLVEVKVVRLQLGLFRWCVWVPAVDLEGLHVLGLARRGTVVASGCGEASGSSGGESSGTCHLRCAGHRGAQRSA